MNSINCPTIGPNASVESNSEYYCTLLNALKYYVEEFSTRVDQHLNGVLQPNLQNEIEDAFRFLQTASMNKIKEETHQYNEIDKFQKQVEVQQRMSERETNINTSSNVSNRNFLTNGYENGMYQQNYYSNQQYPPQENEQLLDQP